MSFDRDVMGRAVRFGWPLLVNGVLLFLVMHGEKLVVGRELGMAALGLFAMGFTLTLTPTLVLARSTQAFFLPQLSALQDEPERFDRMAATTMQADIAAGLVVAAAVVVLGPPFVVLVLGEKYAALGALMPWLAVLQAVRAFKAGASTVALARGRTGNAMIANLPRVAAVGLSWAALARGEGLVTVVGIAILAEVVGFALSLALLRARAGVALAPLAWPLAAGALALGAVVAEAAWLAPRGVLGQGLGAAACAAVLAAALLAMPDLRRYALGRGLVRRLEGEGAGSV